MDSEQAEAQTNDKPRIEYIRITDTYPALPYILFVAGIVLGSGIMLGSHIFTGLRLDTNMADAVTIALAATTLISIGIIYTIFHNAGDTTKEVLKAALWYKSYAIALLLEVDGRLRLKACEVSEEVGSQWRIPRGRVWDEKRLADGTQLNGPDRIDYAIFTSEGATSIDMREKSESELFGTSAYITKIGDLKKAEGYIEGHEDSKHEGFENFFRENWPIIIGIIVILGIGLYVMWDKIMTGPQGWEAANACEKERANIAIACSKYIDVNHLFTTATTLPPSSTGGSVT